MDFLHKLYPTRPAREGGHPAHIYKSRFAADQTPACAGVAESYTRSLMNGFQNFAVVIFVLLLAMPAFAEAPKGKEKDKAPPQEITERGWTLRCPDVKKGEKKYCEIFQRLDMKDAADARVAEFAIGFPEDEKKNVARGVIVLPLGILLESGVAMKIDDNEPFVFKTRYCTNAGCFSYVSLSKDLLTSLRKGKTVTFQFKSFAGQDVNLIMNLVGFEKSLKEIL